MVKIQLGSIISGAIGAAAVIIAAYVRTYLDKRTRRRKLRRALYAEIKSTDTLSGAQDMLKSGSGQYFYLQHDFIPTEVYQSNLDDLGLLSDSEIELVVDYYTTALIAKQERSGCEKVLEYDDAVRQQKDSAIGTFKSTVSALEQTRDNAITELEEYVDN